MTAILKNKSLAWNQIGGRGVGSRILGSDGDDLADLIYRMAPSAMVASRGAGTIYVRTAGPTWRAYTDPTVAPVIGEAIGPTKNVGGYTFRYPYPEWRVGHTPAAGDVFWHNGNEGDTRLVVCVAGGNVMPNAWGLVRPDRRAAQIDDSAGNTWRTDVEYEPEYGVYLEPEITQLFLNPVEAATMHGNQFYSTERYPALIEGYGDIRAIVDRGESGSQGFYRSVAAQPAGDYTCSWLIQMVAQVPNYTDFQINETLTPYARYRYHWATNEMQPLTPGNWIKWRRFRNNILQVWMNGTVPGADFLRAYVYPSATIEGAGQGWDNVRTVSHCINGSAAPFPYEPIPDQTTRPREMPIEHPILRQTFLDEAGAEGQILVIAHGITNGSRSYFGIRSWYDSVSACFGGDSSPRVGQFYTGGNTMIDPTGGAGFGSKTPIVAFASDWGATDTETRGYDLDATTTVQSKQEVGEFAGFPVNNPGTNALLGQANIVQNTEPLTLRALATWKVQDAFVFDNALGPDNYTNQPLPPINPDVVVDAELQNVTWTVPDPRGLVDQANLRGNLMKSVFIRQGEAFLVSAKMNRPTKGANSTQIMLSFSSPLNRKDYVFEIDFNTQTGISVDLAPTFVLNPEDPDEDPTFALSAIGWTDVDLYLDFTLSAPLSPYTFDLEYIAQWQDN